MQVISRLDFDDQPFVDQKIDAGDFGELDPIKNDVDRPLPINLISHRSQAPGKKGFIYTFQQSRPDFAVKTHRNANHIMRNLVDVLRHSLCDLCASARIY